ncbi:uncharacterized protein EI90DRAFT_3291688 [Cantharellus anzutake]|uniref:uncharacterized protein n=1 Tax=Cantharellus anzutake TaxID=1750568 RepID=UPI00190775C1|nr:uncharacterized protein EI90DRAFT_3291688 [Cantharellus anzutake]KAF8325658.1 hypothetical protein EI90DRAFT_3291688 [Cantharellus anzutake]
MCQSVMIPGSIRSAERRKDETSGNGKLQNLTCHHEEGGELWDGAGLPIMLAGLQEPTNGPQAREPGLLGSRRAAHPSTIPIHIPAPERKKSVHSLIWVLYPTGAIWNYVSGNQNHVKRVKPPVYI